MKRTNRNWLPAYCDPGTVLPQVPSTRSLFSRRPFLIGDFFGRLMGFLTSDEIAKTGLRYDARRMVPCRWKCSDESLYGVDLALYAYTKVYPFDKGKIGGRFNAGSIGAAVHHGSINVDIGGSHVGYVPGPGGGSFGKIWRPAEECHTTDCGYLMDLLAPFQQVYRDACENILLLRPDGERPILCVPNEYVHPSWSSNQIKLLVDLDRLTDGEVLQEDERPRADISMGRSRYYLHPDFLATLPEKDAREILTPQPTPIGQHLDATTFNVWDSGAELVHELPRPAMLPYMKYILASRYAPPPLEAAVINTTLEHNRLTDAIRLESWCDYDFVSFTGVFIDMFDESLDSYVNLFQPMGLSIKPRGTLREVFFSAAELHSILERTKPAKPRLALEAVRGFGSPTWVLEAFDFGG